MSKRVEVIDGYVIDIDSMNYTVKKNIKLVEDDDGVLTEVATVVGYYSSIEISITAIAENLGLERLVDGCSLKDALSTLTIALKDINDALK